MSTSTMPEESNISRVLLALPVPSSVPQTPENSPHWSQNVNNTATMTIIMNPLDSDNANIRHDGTDLDLTPGKIAFAVFMFLLNLFMLAGNTISIVTITKTPFLRRRTYYWLVLNLAIVDLINSLTVVPLNTVWELYGVWPFGLDLCNIIICADLAFSAIASYSTVLVSIDKYLYITKPFLYHSISAPCVAIASMVAVWVIWISFSAASVFGDFARNKNLNETLYRDLDICNFVMTDLFAIFSALFTFFIPFFILLFTSVKILCVARKHICRIAANHENGKALNSQPGNTSRRNTMTNTVQTVLRTSIWTTSSSINPSTSQDCKEGNQPPKRKFPPKTSFPKATCRAFGTVMIVVSFFIIMFAPYWFAAIVDVGCSCIQPWVYEDYLSVFYFMHSLVNPYIYMITDRRYKKALKGLCRKHLRRKNSRSKIGSYSSDVLN